jgi:hypothetical protein
MKYNKILPGILVFGIAVLIVLSMLPYASMAGSASENGSSNVAAATTSTTSHLVPVGLVFEGHSPIDINIIGPNGGTAGCGVQDTIPFTFFSGCGTEPEVLLVIFPMTGSWTINWVSRANGGPFTITVTGIALRQLPSTVTFTGTAPPPPAGGSFDVILSPNGQVSPVTTTSSSSSTVSTTVTSSSSSVPTVTATVTSTITASATVTTCPQAIQVGVAGGPSTVTTTITTVTTSTSTSTVADC